MTANTFSNRGHILASVGAAVGIAILWIIPILMVVLFIGEIIKILYKLGINVL